LIKETVIRMQTPSLWRMRALPRAKLCLGDAIAPP
jgi:hypothetical protein